MKVHLPADRPLLYSPGDRIQPQRLLQGRLRLIHYTKNGAALEIFALTPGDVLGFEAAAGLRSCWYVQELEGRAKLAPATHHEAWAEMGPRLLYALTRRAEAWACHEEEANQHLADAIETLRQQEVGEGKPIAISHERLGEVLWATRETITRRVARAEAAGLVLRDGRTYLPCLGQKQEASA